MSQISSKKVHYEKTKQFCVYHGCRWDSSDLELLKTRAHSMSPVEMAMALGRTLYAVYHKSESEGIQLAEKVTKRRGKTVTLQEAMQQRKERMTNGEEIAIIPYGNGYVVKNAGEIAVNPVLIHHKATKLKDNGKKHSKSAFFGI